MSDDRKATGQPRSPGRRATDQSSAESRQPVPIGEAKDALQNDALSAEAGVTAQMLGEGQRRGLKGGKETLQRARTTYLGAEYSGDADRRPKKGRITKTEI
ncbi:MAG TPA: hypothetical protein VG407_14635 [Caulobacteraceae bacterium]|jgi:hypothetical protein|nr:hypothetical protein [Caulobacteraceae bacterium]